MDHKTFLNLNIGDKVYIERVGEQEPIPEMLEILGFYIIPYSTIVTSSAEHFKTKSLDFVTKSIRHSWIRTIGVTLHIPEEYIKQQKDASKHPEFQNAINYSYKFIHLDRQY